MYIDPPHANFVDVDASLPSGAFVCALSCSITELIA